MHIADDVGRNEIELISSARRGDDAAWEQLVRTHQTAVFRLAYLLLGDADEAEDIAQEAFIRAFQALERFDTERPLRPWLLRIASNLASNKRRSAGRYLAALRRMVRLEPSPTTIPGERSAERWDQQALSHAIRRLSHADQEVIYLRYFLELSESDMARTLEIAPGTVKSRLHRAMGRLRDVVRTDFPDLHEGRLG